MITAVVGFGLVRLLQSTPAGAVGELTSSNRQRPVDTIQLDNVPLGAEAWTARTARSLLPGSPRGILLTGTTVYACSSTKRAGLSALSIQGKVLWKHATSTYPRTCPLAMATDGTLFLTDASWVESISPKGHVNWRLRLPHKASTPPTVSLSGTLYLGTSDHCLHAISSMGLRRWKYCTKSLFHARPLVGPGGVVYFVTNGGNLYAVNREGTLKWRVHLINSGLFTRPVLMPDGALYVVVSTTLKQIPATLLKVVRHQSVMTGTFGVLIKINAAGRIQWGLVGPRINLSTPFSDLAGRILVTTAAGGIIVASTLGHWSNRVNLGPTFAHSWVNRGRSGTILVVSSRNLLVLNSGLRPIWRARLGDDATRAARMFPDGSVLIEGKHRLLRVLPPL